MRGPVVDKLQIAKVLLGRGSVYVHFDPRRPGVRLPAHLRFKSHVVFHVGFDMPVPITDLALGSEGIAGTLRFPSCGPVWCCVPWTAIFALVSEGLVGMAWTEDIPHGVSVRRSATRPGGQRAHLHIVKGGSGS